MQGELKFCIFFFTTRKTDQLSVSCESRFAGICKILRAQNGEAITAREPSEKSHYAIQRGIVISCMWHETPGPWECDSAQIGWHLRANHPRRATTISPMTVGIVTLSQLSRTIRGTAKMNEKYHFRARDVSYFIHDLSFRNLIFWFKFV